MSRPCSDNFEGSAVWYLEKGSEEPIPLTKGKHLPIRSTVLALPYHPEQDAPPREMFDWNTPDNVFRYEVVNGTVTASRAGFFSGVNSEMKFDVPDTEYERASQDVLLGLLRQHADPTSTKRTERQVEELRDALSKATDRKQLREIDYKAHSLAIEHGVTEELYSNKLAELSPVARLRIETSARLLAADEKHSFERYMQAFDLTAPPAMHRDSIASRPTITAPQLFAVHEVHSSFDDSYDTYAGEAIESVWPTWEQARERAELVTLRDQLMSCATYYGGSVEASAAPLTPGTGDDVRRHARLDLPISAAPTHDTAWESGCAWVVVTSHANDDHGPSTLCRIGGVFATRAEAAAHAASISPLTELLSHERAAGGEVWVDNHPLAKSSGTPVSGLFNAEPGQVVNRLDAAQLSSQPAATVVAYPVQ